VLDTIIRLVGSKSKVVYKPRRSWDTIVRRVADVQYAKKVLGYEPKISVEEGLRKYCDWMKDRDFSKCKW
jgi:UDP-glucuronate decarboxylase